MRLRIPNSSRPRNASSALAVASALAMLFAGAVLVTVPAGTAQAQEKARQVQALRERVFQSLAKAQELMEKEDYAGAKRELDQVRGIQDLNSYERGQILYFSGLVEYQRDNLAAAVRLFEQAVALPDLPEGFRTDTIWALVQLAMAAEQYRKVLEYGNEWLKTAENPSGDPFYLLAVAHYQLKEYRKTVEMMDRAIQIAERDGKYAREDWYGLLRAGLHELGDTRRLRSILELLVARWPKKEYWIHLSTIYGELNEERKQVAALEVIYEAGWMSRENEVLQLAQLYMQRGGAYKGARMLEKGMEDGLIERNERNYRLLAQAWMQAQDDRRSIPPLREAARRSNDGQLYLQLAQSHLNLYQYNECVEAARTALGRGGLRRPGHANIVLGTCLLELQRFDQAREAFRAARSDSSTRSSADRWINFIDREVARKRDIEQQLARLQDSRG
ncbi:MAG: tetratricopeptide repeat protein [Gammaproteobacteria bacterium]